MLVTNALQGGLTLLICIAIGMYMGKKGYLCEMMEGKLSVLTLRFAVPCLLFLNCQTYIDRALLRGMGWSLMIPLLTILITYGIGLLVAGLFKIETQSRGLFLMMFSMSNAIFIGIPVCLAVFGEQSLPLVAIYFPFNTLLFYTIGTMGLARSAGMKIEFKPQTLRQIFSPPLMGALLGAAAALLEIPLPSFFTEAIRHVGNLTTPVTLLVTGSTLVRMGKSALNISKVGILTIVGRFAVSPAISLLLCVLFGAPSLTAQVFTVEAAMPVMSQSLLVARAYKANHQMAAQMIAVTTLVGLFLMPLVVYLLTLVT